MDTNLKAILTALVQADKLDARLLLRLQRLYPRDARAVQPFYTKAEILAAFQEYRDQFAITQERVLELEKFLRVKPIRTQSGVATVTILTKPWPCPGHCLFCPADARMPKSYLANEPGAQRAEANWFDPYLQVTNRLEALASMGHNLDKIEIIILGGTWDAYPEKYRLWFIGEVFRALNDFPTYSDRVEEREKFYQDLDEQLATTELTLSNRASANEKRVAKLQDSLDSGRLTYNEFVAQTYLFSQREKALQKLQTITLNDLKQLHQSNSQGIHRCVGLVIETRPDEIEEKTAMAYRELGCTKIQIGIQSVNQEILDINLREINVDTIAHAFAILRLYGFKIHAHFMANLYGSTPDSDINDFKKFVTDPRFLPDEIKLYPCALLQSSPLMSKYREGSWLPYSEKQLLEVLVANMQVTPPYVRISRMIRDFSANDIVSGNKKTNFRQLVDSELKNLNRAVQEIRTREIRAEKVDPTTLQLQDYTYQTSVTTEHFLQYVTPENKLVGFLRLSLPKELEIIKSVVPEFRDELGFLRDRCAMIREVHVYGVVSALGAQSNSQHLGLGKKLIARATQIAKDTGYSGLRVISAIGTREYYATQGFREDGLYQIKDFF